MADEEAKNPDANAEPQDSGAESPAEDSNNAPAEAAPAPSIWMPVIVGTILSIGGAFALLKFVLLKSIESSIEESIDNKIAAFKDANGTLSAPTGEQTGKGTDKTGQASGGSDTTEPDEGGTADASPDESGGTINILEEGGTIVVNPAGSGGKVYLAVEIVVKRKDPTDKGFKKEIQENSKELEAIASNLLSSYDVTRLNQATIRDITTDVLKRRFNAILDEKHQIGELLMPKWIMQ